MPVETTLQPLALDERAAAKLLSVSTKTMSRLRDKGAIKYFRATDSDSAKVLYSQKALVEFIRRREAAQ
jgi:hypothetical protein